MEKVLSAAVVKSLAREAGFDACGVAPAGRIYPDHEARFHRFVQEKEYGDMGYMSRNEELRYDPRNLVENARAVVSVALSYAPSPSFIHSGCPLSFYALGKDYHTEVKKRLKHLLQLISLHHFGIPSAVELQGSRLCCDTAPVAERFWAWRCGLGRIGRNKTLIIPGKGSYFFLGEVILTCDVDSYDAPLRDDCGSCCRCVEACPMKALDGRGDMDARRCLSYLTIEHKGDLPREARMALSQVFYGCDRCQRACPENMSPLPPSVQAFAPSPALLSVRRDEWASLPRDRWDEIFAHSAVKRVGYERFLCLARESERED